MIVKNNHAPWGVREGVRAEAALPIGDRGVVVAPYIYSGSSAGPSTNKLHFHFIYLVTKLT